MTVRNTRLLRGRVQAEVGLGSAANGEFIGVRVELDLANPEVKAAVATLHEVIEAQAMNKVSEAMDNRRKWQLAEARRRSKKAAAG